MPLFKVSEQELLERIVGRSPSANYYLVLCTSKPEVKATPKEIEEKYETKYKGYERFKMTGGTTSSHWEKAAEGEGPAKIKTSKAITMASYNSGGSGSETSSVCTYFAIVNVKLAETTSEKALGFGALKASVTVSEGNPTPEWASEALEVTLE